MHCAVASGVVTFYSMVVITASFYVKNLIGQNVWRAIHMSSFGTFVGAALHGIFSGTGSGHPAVFGSYIASSVIVVMLLVIRIAQAASAPVPDAGGVSRAARQASLTARPHPEPAESTAT